ncbi:hypothetical protein B0H10DRAFT_2001877 [Mycena sp. CBHHK59/15]|nr:hypothetical protein B0H10DRAFT_2001877 [Mycena sp. CBHHK59/15]
MLRRLSRARIPFRRCLQTQPPPRPASTSTKYAIVVGTFATVAFLGSRLAEKPPIALDSSPSREFAPPPLPTFQHPASAASTSTIPDKRVVPKSKEVLSKQNGLSEEALSAPIPSTAPSESAAVQDVVQTEEDANTSNDGDSGGGAFNPETGEINWDCPCLGGMADGPCGPEFREAFSCFVYSEDEPKGINCVEKFQGMQTCFREHPEVYASGAFIHTWACSSER